MIQILLVHFEYQMKTLSFKNLSFFGTLMQILFKIWIAKMIMIQIYSSELFLREKDKNCVNSDQYTEYFEDIWGSKVGSIEIPESYITCLAGIIGVLHGRISGFW